MWTQIKKNTKPQLQAYYFKVYTLWDYYNYRRSGSILKAVFEEKPSINRPEPFGWREKTSGGKTDHWEQSHGDGETQPTAAAVGEGMVVARLYVERGDDNADRGDASGLRTGRVQAECWWAAVVVTVAVGESRLTSSPSSESHTSLCK